MAPELAPSEPASVNMESWRWWASVKATEIALDAVCLDDDACPAAEVPEIIPLLNAPRRWSPLLTAAPCRPEQAASPAAKSPGRGVSQDPLITFPDTSTGIPPMVDPAIGRRGINCSVQSIPQREDKVAATPVSYTHLTLPTSDLV